MAGLNLKAYQGTSRLLLLFVPGPSYDEFIGQWQVLYRHEDGLQARDLRVISLFEDDVGDVDGEPIYEDEAAQLRQQFRVKDNMSVAILIGKDGKEKHRLPMPVDPDKLFGLIDAMPMRQQEMRERGEA